MPLTDAEKRVEFAILANITEIGNWRALERMRKKRRIGVNIKERGPRYSLIKGSKNKRKMMAERGVVRLER